MAIEFIECTSLNVSYDKFGIVTVSFTIVHDTPGFKVMNTITAGGQTFSGYVVNASVNSIPNTVGWYETHTTLITTTN